MNGTGRRRSGRSGGRWRGGARWDGALIAPEGVAKIEGGLRTTTAGGTSATVGAYRLAVVSGVGHDIFALSYGDVNLVGWNVLQWCMVA